MREYKPDNWSIIELSDGKGNIHWRVAAGWAGGYTQGRSWKINSGIASFSQDDDGYYQFMGESGSVYHCHQQAEGLDWYTKNIVDSYHEDAVKVGGYVKELTVHEFLEKWVAGQKV